MEHYHLNNQITDLWNKFNLQFDDYHQEVMNRVPSYLNKPSSNNKILFIGLNPAFQDREENHKNYINYCYKPDMSIDEIINFCQINEDSKNPEKTKLYYGKYFNILHNFAKNLGEKGFEHCDLFLMRETDSKTVKKMVENPAGDLNEFGIEQLNILKTHISNLNPKMIIIPNAMAAEYYRKILLQNSNIDDEKGIYYSEINNKRIPTILCGSWQYGRLDKYTEAILVRHIKSAMS
jgi:hypothetical protein